jgi:hypothetical protein
VSYPKVMTLAVGKSNGRSSCNHRIFFELSDLMGLGLSSGSRFDVGVMDFEFHVQVLRGCPPIPWTATTLQEKSAYQCRYCKFQLKSYQILESDLGTA